MKYHVTVKEVHDSIREVTADSEQEAFSLAENLETEFAMEFSHTLDRDLWTIDKAE